jgi:hypothetical protein
MLERHSSTLFGYSYDIESRRIVYPELVEGCHLLQEVEALNLVIRPVLAPKHF